MDDELAVAKQRLEIEREISKLKQGLTPIKFGGFTRWVNLSAGGAVELPVQSSPPVAGNATSDSTPDGPFGTDGFRWIGQPYHGLTRKAFLLVESLWNATQRTLALSDVEDAVYGPNDLPPEQGISGVRRTVNRFFTDKKIPLRVTVDRQVLRRVSLLDQIEKTAKRTKKPAKRR